MTLCKAIGCTNPLTAGGDFCEPCANNEFSKLTLAEQYPQQYKPLGDLSEIDVFAVHHLFQLQDPSGCLQHASRMLLSTSGKPPIYQDIKEARDTLTRWMQLNKGTI